MTIKYQENTKQFGTEIPCRYRFVIDIFLVYQIFGYRLTSLIRLVFLYTRGRRLACDPATEQTLSTSVFQLLSVTVLSKERAEEKTARGQP